MRRAADLARVGGRSRRRTSSAPPPPRSHARALRRRRPPPPPPRALRAPGLSRRRPRAAPRHAERVQRPRPRARGEERRCRPASLDNFPCVRRRPRLPRLRGTPVRATTATAARAPASASSCRPRTLLDRANKASLSAPAPFKDASRVPVFSTAQGFSPSPLQTTTGPAERCDSLSGSGGVGGSLLASTPGRGRTQVDSTVRLGQHGKAPSLHGTLGLKPFAGWA